MSNASWLNDFVNPPAMFRPVSFWSWNERMDTDEEDGTYFFKLMNDQTIA